MPNHRAEWMVGILPAPGILPVLKVFPNVQVHLRNRRNRALNEAAFSALDLRFTDSVLDVGFGGGYLLKRIADVVPDGHAAGVDLSPAMVSFCNRRYGRLVHEGRLQLKGGGVTLSIRVILEGMQRPFGILLGRSREWFRRIMASSGKPRQAGSVLHCKALP